MPGHDYSQPGDYFVTICTRNRECLLGSVSAGRVELSQVGQYVREEWAALPERFPTIEMDAFVVMPNHLHGIIVIKPVGALLAAPRSENTGDAASGAPTVARGGTGDAASGAPTVARGGTGDAASGAPTVGDIVRAFKSITGIKGNQMLDTPGRALWQRNYYERVVRDDEELAHIREYVALNPSQWDIDRENPEVQKEEGGKQPL